MASQHHHLTRRHKRSDNSTLYDNLTIVMLLVKGVIVSHCSPLPRKGVFVSPSDLEDKGLSITPVHSGYNEHWLATG